MSDELKRLSQKIRNAKSKAMRIAAKELAIIIPEVIRLRTRDGFGANGKLDPLTSDQYIKLRERSDYLSSDTTPRTSNLTATGQLLDAITGRASGTKIKITVNNKKRGRELSGKRSGKSNNEVRELVEDNGREFLKFTKVEEKEALELATQIIKEEINKVIN